MPKCGCRAIETRLRQGNYSKELDNYLAKLRLKPTNNASVFFDFRVYKGSVNTEIKEHGMIIYRFEAQLR